MGMNDVMMTRVVTSSEGFVVCVVIVMLRCSPHHGINILSSSWIADYHLNVACFLFRAGGKVSLPCCVVDWWWLLLYFADCLS